MLLTVLIGVPSKLRSGVPDPGHWLLVEMVINGIHPHPRARRHHRRGRPRANDPAEDLAFRSRQGAVLRNGNFRSQVFDAAAARAGLAELTPHELRHTAASLAVAAGANIKAVQRMLGHASAAMALDVYAGLFGDDLDDLARRLDEAARKGQCGPGAD